MSPGIQDNAQELSRFRRQLEERSAALHTAAKADEVVVYEEPAMDAANTTSHGSHHDGHMRHNPKPVAINANPAHGVNITHETNAEKVRKMLVNNYRPVQPLNGRVVYRSFPFFDEPLKKDTEVVYIDLNDSEARKGSASFLLGSLTLSVCSVVLSILL